MKNQFFDKVTHYKFQQNVLLKSLEPYNINDFDYSSFFKVVHINNSYNLRSSETKRSIPIGRLKEIFGEVIPNTEERVVTPYSFWPNRKGTTVLKRIGVFTDNSVMTFSQFNQMITAHFLGKEDVFHYEAKNNCLLKSLQGQLYLATVEYKHDTWRAIHIGWHLDIKPFPKKEEFRGREHRVYYETNINIFFL